MNKQRKTSHILNVFQYDHATGIIGLNGAPVSGYGLYLTTNINDGSVGIDSSASINALYLLKNTTKQFEISYDTSGATKIFRLLPYQSGSFFQIGNPSNAANSNSDYVFISESVYGNVLIGPGIGNGTGNLTGATASIHKVQFNGAVFANNSIQATSFKITGGASTGFLKADGTVDAVTYLSGNQSITVSGDATGSGTTSIALTLANTAVTPGVYGSATLVPVVTVDSKGRITSVTTAAISGSLTFTGDVTGSGTTGTSTGLTLAASGVTAGTYTKVTVDSKGRVTVGASATTTDIAEGTRLYYTDARVLSYLSANTYATQSYVNTQVSNLVASAPATLDTLNELAAALGNDPSFATTISTALGNRLRVDINNQGLSATLQGYGRTNLGLGTAAISATGDFATAAQGTKADTVFGWGNHASAGYLTSALAATTYVSLTGAYANPAFVASLAYSKITGVPAFLTSYTETDTLATVTARGASTTASISAANFQNAYQVLSLNNIKTPGLYNYDGGITGTQPLGSEWYNVKTIEVGADSRYSQFVMPYFVDRIFYRRKSDAGFQPYVELYHSGNLTNLNQLTNGPGYITGYTETDTLATVTSRGASTSTASIFSSSLAVGNSSHYDSSQFSLDVNGGVLIKNTGKTAQLILQNANPAAGGNNGFVQHLVGGTTTGAFASIQTYYGASVAAGTLQLQPNGGSVTIGGSTVYHGGNLPTIPTNNNQLTNGAGYITSSGSISGTAGSISGFNNPTTAATANTIAYRDGSGDLYARYFLGGYINTSDNVDTGTITYIMAKFGDNYHRSATAAKVQAFLGLGSLAYSSATIPTNTNQLTNGAGYITSDSTKLPLAGGTMTGTITITNTDIRSNSTSNWTGEPGTQGKIQYHASRWYIVSDSASDRIVQFRRNSTDTSWIANDGTFNGSITGNAATVTNGLYTNNYSGTLDGRYFFDYGFTTGYPGTEANAMPGNRSAFTYSNGAPLSGCIAHFGAGGYGIQLNGDYGGDSFSMRSRNGDAGTWRPWKRLLTDYNYNSYSPTLTGTGASGTWGISITGNAATATTASNLAANTSPTIQVLNFTGVGGNSGNANQGYAIYQEGGAWTHPYPDLCIGYHTGIKIGAHFSYNGIRFYNNSDMATETFSVGNGDNHVRVANNLYVTGTVTGSNLSGTNTGDQTNISGNAATATTAARATRANGNFYIDDNYGNSIIGVYSSTILQGVFAMGDAYKLTAGGGANNLYGLAWSHPNAGGQAANLSSHGLLVMQNGVTMAAISTNIWISGQFTGSGAGLTGTASSLSIGGNATTAGGLAVHGGTNNEVNKIVRTDASGYIQAGWINSISGNMGFENRITRITCSNDQYMRFQALTEFKVSMGMSGKNDYSRRIDYTTDANYHVGSFGHGGAEVGNIDRIFHYGSGFFDVWSGNGTYAPGTTHIHGFNVLHYTTGYGGSAYGWQMASQYNQTGLIYARWCSGGSFSAWQTIITSTNIGSHRAGSTLNWYATSHPNDYYLVNNWTGTHWQITSNHGAGVRVAYADSAGSAPANGGTSSNTNSISNALGNTHDWTNINYFVTNNGGQAVNNSNSAKLQAYSSGNNSAFMSFHKGGHFAVNFGLDDDNVMRIGGWSAGANRWQLDMSGNMTVAGDVTAYSDARVKTNIQTITNALDKTLALRGVTYTRTDSDDKKTKIGVIAQETLPIVPEVVNQDNAGMYNVSYGNITALLIEAIKEQQLQIEELKNKLDNVLSSR